MARSPLTPEAQTEIARKVQWAQRQNQKAALKRGDDGSVTPLAGDHAVLEQLKKKTR